jgi:hypothetical protein
VLDVWFDISLAHRFVSCTLSEDMTQVRWVLGCRGNRDGDILTDCDGPCLEMPYGVLRKITRFLALILVMAAGAP